MKEAVNLCDMLCYWSSALFNVSDMFLTRHATEHAVRVGVTVAGAFAFGCAGTFAGHAATEAPCASATRLNAAGVAQRECDWCTAKRPQLEHVVPEDMPLLSGIAYPLHQKVAFLIKASDHIRNVEHNLSPHVQRVLTTWRAAYGAHQAVIASRTHHLQTAYLFGVSASARGLQAPLLQVWLWSRR